jgi:hypothetical protein
MNKQERQEMTAKRTATNRALASNPRCELFAIGEVVELRNLANEWESATIVATTSRPGAYKVRMEAGPYSGCVYQVSAGQFREVVNAHFGTK